MRHTDVDLDPRVSTWTGPFLCSLSTKTVVARRQSPVPWGPRVRHDREYTPANDVALIDQLLHSRTPSLVDRRSRGESEGMFNRMIPSQTRIRPLVPWWLILQCAKGILGTYASDCRYQAMKTCILPWLRLLVYRVSLFLLFLFLPCRQRPLHHILRPQELVCRGSIRRLKCHHSP